VDQIARHMKPAPLPAGLFFDAGNAVRLATEEVRKKWLILRASRFKVYCGGYCQSKADGSFNLQIQITASLSKNLIGIAIYVTGGPLLGSASWLDSWPFPDPLARGLRSRSNGTFLFGTHVAEVELTRNRQNRILHITACHDVGKAIYPAGVLGQIERSGARDRRRLFEEMCLQDGRVVNPSFVDYRMLPPWIPLRSRRLYIERPDPTGSFGAKGLGEPPSFHRRRPIRQCHL